MIHTATLEVTNTIHDGDVFVFRHDEFDMRLEVSYDMSPDTSWIGEFSDNDGAGAIDHHATGTWLDRSWRGPRFFIPCNYDPSEPQNAKIDYKRLVAFHQGDWNMVHLGVTALKEGIKLGTASIGGVESDSGKNFFYSLVMEELVPEAVEEARDAVKRLCACVK
jgi:hypothetical protein